MSIRRRSGRGISDDQFDRHDMTCALGGHSFLDPLGQRSEGDLGQTTLRLLDCRQVNAAQSRHDHVIKADYR